MTSELTTSGIDQVKAEPVPPWGWVVRFRSSNKCLQHQLYVNGQLADWTDTSDQRSFFCAETALPLEIRIAAVRASLRTTDMSQQLPVDEVCPSWIYRPQLMRPVAARRGEILEILSDHTTGQVSEVPLASAEIWPAWIPRWAFGEDSFGQGGFGYDGTGAPGLGGGAFGAGLFGMNADLIDLQVYLHEDGTHQIVLRTRQPDGQIADLAPVSVRVISQPDPPAGLRAISYSQESQQLELEIN